MKGLRQWRYLSPYSTRLGVVFYFSLSFTSLQFCSIVLQMSSIVTDVLFSENGSPNKLANLLIVKNAVLNEGDGDGSSLHITETFSSKEPEMMNVRLLGNPKKVKL